MKLQNDIMGKEMGYKIPTPKIQYDATDNETDQNNQ